MKKYLLGLLLTGSFAIPAIALDGVAVIDLRTAVLATQAAKDAFEALEEESEYSGNLEQARVLQTDRQSLAEKLQKEAETLSQEEITDIQRSIQEKSKDLEFIVGKIQTIQTETIQEKDNPKKSVRWKDNENYEEKYKLLQENYYMLQEEFMQMKNKIAESI